MSEIYVLVTDGSNNQTISHILDSNGVKTLCGCWSAWGTPMNDLYYTSDVKFYRLSNDMEYPSEVCDRCQQIHEKGYLGSKNGQNPVETS